MADKPSPAQAGAQASTPKSWTDYWNADTPIYVNQRHKTRHYKQIATDFAAFLPDTLAPILDYGCGEALSAELLAVLTSSLTLVESAPLIRARLTTRFGQNSAIHVIDVPAMHALPEGTFSRIFCHSVAQYIPKAELPALLTSFYRLSAPQGALLLSDILPETLSPLTDAAALLRFGWQGGFAGAALMGLVRTTLSDYRTLRSQLGLTHYTAPEIETLLAQAGFTRIERVKNPGHNPARQAYLAFKS